MIRKALLALSFALLIATAALWWRSHVKGDGVIYEPRAGVAAILHADGAVTVGIAVFLPASFIQLTPFQLNRNYERVTLVSPPGPVIERSSGDLTWIPQKVLFNIVPSLPSPARMSNALSLGHIPEDVFDAFRWDFKYASPRGVTWVAAKLAVPYWFIAFGLVLAIYVQIYGWLHPARRRRKRGLCVKCAYDLTGNESGVCPECGHAI